MNVKFVFRFRSLFTQSQSPLHRILSIIVCKIKAILHKRQHIFEIVDMVIQRFHLWHFLSLSHLICLKLGIFTISRIPTVELFVLRLLNRIPTEMNCSSSSSSSNPTNPTWFITKWNYQFKFFPNRKWHCIRRERAFVVHLVCVVTLHDVFFVIHLNNLTHFYYNFRCRSEVNCHEGNSTLSFIIQIPLIHSFSIPLSLCSLMLFLFYRSNNSP